MKCFAKKGLYAERSWYHPMALFRRLLNYYIAICLLLFFLQNQLLFPRWISGAVLSADDAKAEAVIVGLIPWQANLGETSILQGYVPVNFTKSAPRGTIVVFHGNAGCAFDRTYYVEAFARRGFRTFLYEYPGYGGRKGSPCASSIISDAQNLIRSLDRLGYGPIYIWGESVGSGVAAAVCQNSNLPIRGLTLLTPWDSLSHAAAVHYPIFPVAFLLWDKYDSISNLQRFTHPICVVCSADDQILPVQLGLNLFNHLPDLKKLILYNGVGHNDWPSSPELPWWDDALNFITSENRS